MCGKKKISKQTTRPYTVGTTLRSLESGYNVPWWDDRIVVATRVPPESQRRSLFDILVHDCTCLCHTAGSMLVW